MIAHAVFAARATTRSGRPEGRRGPRTDDLRFRGFDGLNELGARLENMSEYINDLFSFFESLLRGYTSAGSQGGFQGLYGGVPEGPSPGGYSDYWVPGSGMNEMHQVMIAYPGYVAHHEGSQYYEVEHSLASGRWGSPYGHDQEHEQSKESSGDSAPQSGSQAHESYGEAEDIVDPSLTGGGSGGGPVTWNLETALRRLALDPFGL